LSELRLFLLGGIGTEGSGLTYYSPAVLGTHRAALSPPRRDEECCRSSTGGFIPAGAWGFLFCFGDKLRKSILPFGGCGRIRCLALFGGVTMLGRGTVSFGKNLPRPRRMAGALRCDHRLIGGLGGWGADQSPRLRFGLAILNLGRAPGCGWADSSSRIVDCFSTARSGFRHRLKGRWPTAATYLTIFFVGPFKFHGPLGLPETTLRERRFKKAGTAVLSDCLHSLGGESRERD